jgi:hypothetical protein
MTFEVTLIVHCYFCFLWNTYSADEDEDGFGRPKQTDRCSAKALGSHSGDARFEFRPEHLLSRLSYLVAFLKSCN